MKGVVYLVGAGPGDPELITVKGRRLLAGADAVLYDHLSSPAMLELARPGADLIYVGKKAGRCATPQEDITQSLIVRARAGQTVVRLKGGDPYLFGRGGEEAEALADAGVPFEVVPGVTTASGLAAYSGVPLTHRSYASAVTFVSGHFQSHVDWGSVSRAGTIVLFMGISRIEEIVAELIQHGRAADSPAVVVRWATRPDQVSIACTLAELPERIQAVDLKPPATVVIGEVARLRSKLGWFERLPLFGQKIVVTRAQGQASELTGRLRSLGADPVELPTISIEAVEDYGPLDACIAQMGTYDWLIFTSVNGVRFFLERLDRSSTDLRALKARICAIGPATRAALEKLHLKVDAMPDEYVAEGVLQALNSHDMRGQRVLLPRAAVARDVLPEQLRARGATVDVVPAYRTLIPADAAGRALGLLDPKPDWITFTSASTVQNFVKIAGPDALQGVKVASIGPVTTKAAETLGVTVTVEAARYTLDGLVEAILAFRA